jgi:DedD protein
MSKDKPFRELQFSSAQLVVVFLGILILGVFIFLLGISVGKKQNQLAAGAGPLVPVKTETVTPKTPVSPDPAPAAKPEEANPPVNAPDKPPVKPADKPEVKPSEKPPDKPAVKPGEPGGGGTEAKPKPADAKPPIVAEKAAPATAKPAPDAGKPTAAKAPATKAAPTAEVKDAKPKGRFYVQIGAVTDKPAAKLYGERVELLGFPSRVLDPMTTDKKTVFRVRIGPYETKAEADDAQGKLAAALKKKKTDFFIVVD